MKTATRTKQVFLAYTRSSMCGWQHQLIKIYSKSSYQAAYDWLADIAERHGNSLQPLGLKYPTVGEGKIVAQTINPTNGQVWWLERHEVV